jgi:hypothetical protein
MMKKFLAAVCSCILIAGTLTIVMAQGSALRPDQFIARAWTWTGIQSFTSSTLVLLGSSSGSSTLNAPASGGGTVVLPTGSGTLVYSGSSAPASSIAVGTTTLSPSTPGDMLYDSAGKVGELSTTGSAGSVVLSTSPTISGLTVTSSLTATGLITLADLSTITASTLVGNPTGSSATPSLITLGSGLAFSGTTLTATGSGGTVTSVTCGTGLSGGTITSTGTCTLNLSNANTWAAVQTFGNGALSLAGSSSGYTLLEAAAVASGMISFPAVTDTVAVLGTAQSFTKPQRVKGGALTISSSTFTPDLNAQQDFEITLIHASCPCTIANPSNISSAAADHQHGVIIINQSSTGSDTIGTWGSQWVAAGGGVTSLTLSTGVSAQDIFSYDVVDSTHIFIAPAGLNVSH